MIRKCLLLFLFVLLRTWLANAQSLVALTKEASTKALEKKVASLTQQTNTLKVRLHQSVVENQRLQAQIANLQQIILFRNDSLARQQAVIESLHRQIGQLTTKNQQLQVSLAERTAELKAANTQIVHLEYDKKALIDNHIIRIYNFSAEDVRKQFVRSLSAPESGFQYDDALIDDEIQITRNFDDQAEAWWVFDKTLDTILELKIRIKSHLYDPQKALVFGEAKLLQKTRYSNKPFDEQRDREKINLYCEKTLRLLEGKLSGTSDK